MSKQSKPHQDTQPYSRREFLKTSEALTAAAVVSNLPGGSPVRAASGSRKSSPSGTAAVSVGGEGNQGDKSLKVVTINTGAYEVAPRAVDRRSEALTVDEDMRIVAIEHFTGVGKGSWSDNGHMLSTNPENPWVKWASAGTGMEPTGTKGYFGYCGRDYYSEVSGIGDVMSYETFPAGCHVLVKKGEKLYMHCYACNFNETPAFFHHAVRLLYW